MKKGECKSYILTKVLRSYRDVELLDFLLAHRFMEYRQEDLKKFTGLDEPELESGLKCLGDAGLVVKTDKGYTYGNSKLAAHFAGSALLIAQHYHEKHDKKK